MADLFVGLVHYPIYNKRMQVIATAVTNFDIHDIARTARTYDVKKYFLIHPHNAQKEIIQKIIGYWQHGFGRVYNPDRSEALDRVAYVADIAAAIDEVRKMTGKEPQHHQLPEGARHAARRRQAAVGTVRHRLWHGKRNHGRF